MDGERFLAGGRDLGLALDESTARAFAAFEAALYEANQTHNLTRVPQQDAWSRHFLDSLLVAPLIPIGAAVLDLGSGPGLPAWPLARARPDLEVVALDSNGKMLEFLRSQPLPNLRIVASRAEDFREREAFDVVTGRALAPLPIQLELSAAFARVGGAVLPLRSQTERATIEALDAIRLGLRRENIVACDLAGGDTVRLIPVYRKVTKTPNRFPRSWTEIKLKPGDWSPIRASS